MYKILTEDDPSFEWDNANREHISRHNVSPQEIAELFWNEAMDLNYELQNGEERWTSVGHTNQLRILVVVWTMRAESIRPVTAFEAGKRLTNEYIKRKGCA
jgi:uncharacterized DUF497 family protein